MTTSTTLLPVFKNLDPLLRRLEHPNPTDQVVELEYPCERFNQGKQKGYRYVYYVGHFFQFTGTDRMDWNHLVTNDTVPDYKFGQGAIHGRNTLNIGNHYFNQPAKRYQADKQWPKPTIDPTRYQFNEDLDSDPSPNPNTPKAS